MDRQVDRAPVTPPTARRRSRSFSILRALLLTLVVAYALFGGAVALAMLQPPERFGRIMTHLPAPLVWGLLPAPRMWLWARAGRLQEGDPAPDFTLATFDHSRRVTLSSHRGDRPVVLVFGSYT
jgi:hypothetical protein